MSLFFFSKCDKTIFTFPLSNCPSALTWRFQTINIQGWRWQTWNQRKTLRLVTHLSFRDSACYINDSTFSKCRGTKWHTLLNYTHTHTHTHTYTHIFNAKEFVDAHSYTVYYSNQWQNKWRKGRVIVSKCHVSYIQNIRTSSREIRGMLIHIYTHI